MSTIYELMQRAATLRKKNETDSISPEEVGGLHFDTLGYLNDFEQRSSALGILRVYPSVAELQADAQSPLSSAGKPLKYGQLVCVYNEDTPSADGNGNVYAYTRPGWILVGNLGDVAGIEQRVNSALAAAISEESAARTAADEQLQRLVDLLLNGHSSEAIDNLNEVLSFLEGIQDDSRLSGLLAAMNSRLEALSSAQTTLAQAMEQRRDGNTLNITAQFPPAQGFHTLQSARQAVPENRREQGVCLTYEVSEGQWETRQWVGSSEGDWDADAYWKEFGGGGKVKGIRVNGEDVRPDEAGIVDIRTPEVDTELDTQSAHAVSNAAVSRKIADLVAKSGTGLALNSEERDGKPAFSLSLLNEDGEEISRTQAFSGGGGEGTAIYSSLLYCSAPQGASLVCVRDSMPMGFRFSGWRSTDGVRENIGVRCTLEFQRSLDNGTSWTSVGTLPGALDSVDSSDTQSLTEIDIAPYLTGGKQRLRARAYYTYTDDKGQERTARSVFVPIGMEVVKTQLSLVCQQNWHTPLYAEVCRSAGGFPISYMVYGSVAKTLHVEIGGPGVTQVSADYALSESDDSVTLTKRIADAASSAGLLRHGVRTVRAYLTCNDGLGGTLRSEMLVNRFMMVDPATAEDELRPYLLVQNELRRTDNYATARLMEYAVYSPVRVGDMVVNRGPDVPLVFTLAGYSETWPAEGIPQYFRMETLCTPGTAYTLDATVEMEGETAAEVSAYLHVSKKVAGEREEDMLAGSTGESPLVITVDNSESYVPVAGASFLLNPKARDNSEVRPDRILNARNGGAEVPATFTGFGWKNDGWLRAEDGQKVLRIPGGAQVNIQYNPFAQFLRTPDSGMTLEIDFAVRNVTNEIDPIIALCEGTGLFRGLRMRAMTGNLFTKNNTVESETDFHWAEGERTHIAINIHNAVTPGGTDALVPEGSPTLNTQSTRIALVRVFIDGVIQRELRYSVSDAGEFCTGEMSNGGLTLGHEGVDLDIYLIRCYTNTALEARDVLRNYISTLPSTEEKRASNKRNDILTGGRVDINKVHALGIRTLIWHGAEPYHESTGAQTGWWEIRQYNAAGEYLPEYSGTLCKATKSLKATRQGSTANTYYYSNLQTKLGDVTETIRVKRADFHSSITLGEPTQGDTGTWTIGIYGGNLGKYDPVRNVPVAYPYDPETDSVTVPDGWMDGNGKYRGMGYMVAEGTPLASKLVNKINYASSMQSHLCGANNLYNDLHTRIVGRNSLQRECATARVSKYTEPFLFFTQGATDDAPVYRGGCSFGAGKMDKPTWGYSKKLHPMFCMVEGSDNNYPLTDFRVLFETAEGCPERVTYDEDAEGWFYNGMQCLDIDAGDMGNTELVDTIADTWNFIYLHSPMIGYYHGTFEAFAGSDAAGDVFKKYWCTDGSEAYRLKRYDFVGKRWVDAGRWNTTAGRWNIIDLRTDAMTAATYNASVNRARYRELNEELKSAIVAHARRNIGSYFKVDSLKLYYTTVIHLLAGTDSCSKNTYYVLDPTAVTVEGDTGQRYLFEMHTDDVDTLLPVDNNGRATKEYQIDRMNPYNEGDTTTSKYEGMNNVLFNLCEAMWEGTKELQAMMRRVFDTMEQLVGTDDTLYGWPGGQKVSLMGCMWKYFYRTHYYIPETAYNEQARIRYEYPEMLDFVSSGSGARGVRPITQSNGNLHQCEIQFFRRRLVLMASYAAWGPFFDSKGGDTGLPEATTTFSLQAFHKPGEDTSNNNYTMVVTPHQYIYPTGMMGQTTIDPHVRVAPGQSFALNLGDTTSNDTGLSLLGVNYYRSIGNVGNLSTPPQTPVTVSGVRLVEFMAEPTQLYTDGDRRLPAFRPKNIRIAAPNLRRLSLRGLSGTEGAVDLSALRRLETADLRATALSEVTLPQGNRLTEVRFPSGMTALRLPHQQGLRILTVDGTGAIRTVEIGGSVPGAVAAPLLSQLAAAGVKLQRLTIENANLGNDAAVNVNTALWMGGLVQAGNATVSGVMTLSEAVYNDSGTRLMRLLGENVFTEEGKPLRLLPPDSRFVYGDTTVKSGTSATYRLISVPKVQGFTPYYTFDAVDSTTGSGDDTVYRRGNARIHRTTGVLESDESDTATSLSVRAYYGTGLYIDLPITVSAVVYPTSILSLRGPVSIAGTGNYRYEAVVLPAGYNGSAALQWTIGGGDASGLRVSPDGLACDIIVEDASLLPRQFNKVYVTLTVTPKGKAPFSKQFQVFSCAPGFQPVVTRGSNAPVMDVLFANGACLDKDYMTREEAAAVADIGTWFKDNTRITSFDEFEYFSHPELTALKETAFAGCTNLTGIRLPQQVEKLNHASFSGCRKLVNIRCDGVKYISGSHTFNDCNSLQSISFPSIDTIGYDYGGVSYMFNACTMLREVTFGEGLKKFEASLGFNACISLRSLRIPDGTEKVNNICIASSAFEKLSVSETATFNLTALFNGYCPKFTTIEVRPSTDGRLVRLKQGETGEVYSSDGTTLLMVPHALTRIVIPEGTVRINEYAMSISRVEAINLPDSVIEVLNYAFSGAQLQSFVAGSGLKTIYMFAFQRSNLITADFSQCKAVCADGAFYECRSLKTVTGGGLTNINTRMFQGCSSLSSVDMSGVTEIWGGAFIGCTALKTIALGDAMVTFRTSGGTTVFAGLTGLLSVQWSIGTPVIPSRTFDSLPSLRTIENIENVTEIGGGAFRGCPLETLTLPAGLTKIGRVTDHGRNTTVMNGAAFSGCTQLRWVKCLATVPPAMEDGDNFDNTTCPIYVPDSSVEAYKGASNWAEYADRIKPISEFTE